MKIKIKLNKFCAVFLASTIIFTTIPIGKVFAGPAILFENRDQHEITKGVIYQTRRQVTEAGFRDIYVLTVPVDDPNIQLEVANSIKEVGFKETVKTLLKDNGAIAGVNGDFFGIRGSHSASFGPEIIDGQIESVSIGPNREGNEFTTFYIENDVNPLIAYTKTDIDFINNGKENIDVFAINKVTDMVMPIIVDQRAMVNTKPIEERFRNTLKVVVDNGAITYISEKGETVNVPANGYVLVISEASEGYFRQFFDVGQKAELKIDTGIDYTNVSTAIGGAGRILVEGQPVSDGLIIEGRQPRTALGITQDKNNIILMVVDGRGHSFGASHKEMGELMKEHGAYNAMHLDGGGSSTIAVKTPGDSEIQVMNNVSDGSQRKVVNALGVYDKSERGTPTSLKITDPNNNGILIQGVGNPLKIVGVDDYLHESEIQIDKVVITSDDAGGYFEGNSFYPSKTGNIHFTAKYGNIVSEADLKSIKLAELQPNISEIRLHKGDSVGVIFNGITENGQQISINSGVKYEVSPPDLGHMQNGKIIADKDGTGYLRCYVGNINTYIPVSIGGKTELIYSFEGEKELKFKSYPESVKGEAAYSAEQKSDGQKSGKITYNFSTSHDPQAVYATFSPRIQLVGSPNALELDVFGDNSGLLVRGRIIDARNKEFTIDFTRNVDFQGWKKLNANISADVKYPISVERVYVASTSLDGPLSGSIYVDNLRAGYPISTGEIQVPASSKYKGGTGMTLATTGELGSFDIAALPKMNLYSEDGKQPAQPADYAATQGKAINQFKQNIKRGFYIGETDIPWAGQGVGITQWNSNYYVHSQDNIGILQMSASKGGFFNTNKTQWQKFSTDIQNSGKDHVIIMMDKNPLNFSDKEELELFTDELVKLEKAEKNIYVVSTEGVDSTEKIVDGIVFINIGSLWTEKEIINDDFRILRFRINGKEIGYELQKLK